MSENNHEELFKTTLMGGFDKDDVMTKVQNLKDQAYAAQKKLEAKIEEKEQEIEKLNRKIREREDKIEELEKNIHEKYQSTASSFRLHQRKLSVTVSLKGGTAVGRILLSQGNMGFSF